MIPTCPLRGEGNQIISVSAPRADYSFAFGFLFFLAIMCIFDRTAHTASNSLAQGAEHTSNWLLLNALTSRQELPWPYKIKSCTSTRQSSLTWPVPEKNLPTGLPDGVAGRNISCNQFVRRARLPTATGDAPSCSLHLCLASIHRQGDLCSTRYHAQRKHCPLCVLLCEFVRTSGNISDFSVPSNDLVEPCTERRSFRARSLIWTPS